MTSPSPAFKKRLGMLVLVLGTMSVLMIGQAEVEFCLRSGTRAVTAQSLEELTNAI